MDAIDGFGGACLEVLFIPFGALLAVGVLIAGALGRPFHLVAILAFLSATWNGGLLWLFWRDSNWSWQQALHSASLCMIAVGALLSLIRKYTR